VHEGYRANKQGDGLHTENQISQQASKPEKIAQLISIIKETVFSLVNNNTKPESATGA
jgi:hypothetical protein